VTSRHRRRSVVLAVARRPSLWSTAFRQAVRLVPDGWWRRQRRWRGRARPLPPSQYLEFRMQTQYGRIDAQAEALDVVNYLRWCKDMRSSST